VQITDAATTTENFALRALPSVTLSGTVTDGSGHGWPLYAEVSVPGTPVVSYTNPATGEYRLTLPQNATYNVTADAVYPGYAQALQTVQAGTSSLTQDFSVAVIAQACAAPGYQFSYEGTTQTFDAATAPPGWSVVNAPGTSYGWEFDNPAGRPNYTGGTGNFAIADSNAHDAAEDTELVSPAVDMSQDTTPYLQFDSDLEGSASDTASVDVSTDGGQSWTTVGSWAGDPGYHGPGPVMIPLPMAARQPDVQVRFHYTSDAGQFWEVDNVFLGNRTCGPVPGGLVEGVVTDGNTGAGLTGATVTSGPSQTVATAPTPADPAIAGGFYDMFSPAGRQQFVAAMNRYASDVTAATVTANAATTVNFALQAGQLSVTPGAISAVTAMGGSATRQVTFTDTGKVAVNVTLYAEPGGFTSPAGQSAAASGAPLQRVTGTFSPLFLPQATGTATQAADTPDGPWVGVASYPTVIMDNAVATDQATGLVYSVGGVTSSGVTTAGYVYNPHTGEWSALPPMAYPREAAQAAFIDGKLYVVGGWDNVGQLVPQLEIYDPATGAWSLGSSIPSPYAAAGVAVLNGNMYIIAGCSNACEYSQVQVYDPVAGTWSAAAEYPVGVGWPSCGTITGEIYCAGGYAYATGISAAYAYSPASNTWSAIAPLPIDLWGSGYTAANGELLVSGGVTAQDTALTNQGYAYDPSVGSWSALPNSDYAVYRVGSACGLYLIGGSSGSINPTSAAEQLPGYAACGSAQVPWLSGSTDSFTVNPGATVTVTETLNAADPSVTQPGSYTALLAIRDDTPYQATPVQVTMTTAPGP
jgi:N-acetylneuraminic acid mutarotase